MSQLALADLEKRITEVVKNSAMGARVQNIVLEQDNYDEDSEFLRIIIRVKDVEDLKDHDLATLTDSIQETVIDSGEERFPSVRFAEAA